MSIENLEEAQDSLRESLRDVRQSILELKQMLDDPGLDLTERHEIEQRLLGLMETNKSGEEQLAKGGATLERLRHVHAADTGTDNLAVVVFFCVIILLLTFVFLW